MVTNVLFPHNASTYSVILVRYSLYGVKSDLVEVLDLISRVNLKLLLILSYVNLSNYDTSLSRVSFIQ